MSISQIISNRRSHETLDGRWQLDPRRSSVEFRAEHIWDLATVKGHFDDYQGRLDLSADPAIELTIDAESIQTGNAKRVSTCARPTSSTPETTRGCASHPTRSSRRATG